MALLRSRLLPLLSALLLMGCDDYPEPPAALTLVQLYQQDQAALARGEALFIGSCAGLCHSLDDGQEAQPDVTDASYLFDCEWVHGGSDDTLFDVITRGIPDTRMVGFGENFPEGDADKWKLIAFLRARQQPCP